MKGGRAGGMIACVLAFVVVGVGLERVRRAVFEPETPPPVPALPHAVAARPLPGPGEEAALRASVEALRRRVAELEQALAAREAERSRGRAQPAAAEGEPESPRRSGRDSFMQRLEQLKRDNPEQYAEMERRREEMRSRMEQEYKGRADFLASLSTQNMTPAQRENHERLLATLAKIEELRARREQADGEGERTEESREEARQAMRESVMELGALYEQERVYLFEQAAAAAGYQGEGASAFVEYLQQAIQSTSMMPFGPSGGRGGGFGGFGGFGGQSPPGAP